VEDAVLMNIFIVEAADDCIEFTVMRTWPFPLCPVSEFPDGDVKLLLPAVVLAEVK
jgi:hypothetical protein